MSNLSERFYKTVGRHFVTLSCVQRQPGISEEKALVFSGFLVKAGGFWFYVTAGHILKDIRASLAEGGEFDVWRFDDQTAGNWFQGAAIPYDFDIDSWIVIEDKEVGYDYAAVALDPYYCNLLIAGGAIPVDKVGWDDHVTDYDELALFGIPSETVAYDQNSIIKCQIAIMPLEHTKAPAEAGRKTENRFYARIKDLGNVKDIDGMSGGPVFGLTKVEGKWKYKVIGLQIGWYQSTRTISACPFALLGTALERFVKAAKASVEPRANPVKMAT